MQPLSAISVRPQIRDYSIQRYYDFETLLIELNATLRSKAINVLATDDTCNAVDFHCRELVGVSQVIVIQI